MASRVYIHDVTIPAATASGVPQVTDTSFPPGDLERVEIMFPRGTAGLVGVRFALAQQPVVPINAGEWLRADNYTWTVALEDYSTSGSWQLVAYNADVYDHTLQVRLHVTEPIVSGSPELFPGPVGPGDGGGGAIGVPGPGDGSEGELPSPQEEVDSWPAEVIQELLDQGIDPLDAVAVFDDLLELLNEIYLTGADMLDTANGILVSVGGSPL